MAHAPRLPWRQKEEGSGHFTHAGIVPLHTWPEGKRWVGAAPMLGLVQHDCASDLDAMIAAEQLVEEMALGVMKALHGGRATASPTPP